MIRALPLPMVLLASACNPPATPSNDANIAANDVAPPPVENSVADEAPPPFAETHPTAPDSAPIPAKFRGTWAANKAACSDLAHHSRLTISGRTIRFSDFVILGESVTTPGSNQFAVKGKVEGTDHPGEAHYSINHTGDVLVDEAGGGAIRVRCG